VRAEKISTVVVGAGPKKSGAAVKEGLYFCGYYIAPTGMLREIGIEAKRIATHIAAIAPAA